MTTKRDLARAVAQVIRCSGPEALAMVNAVFTGMHEKLTQGNRIEIRSFGVFAVKHAKPRHAARNPRTGEITPVPARRKVHFKPGMLLRQALHTPPPHSDDSPKGLGALSPRDAVSKVLRRGNDFE